MQSPCERDKLLKLLVTLVHMTWITRNWSVGKATWKECCNCSQILCTGSEGNAVYPQGLALLHRHVLMTWTPEPWGSLDFFFLSMVSIPSRKAPSQWVAKALTSETKTQTKLAHIWTEGIFCPWRVNSLGQFFKAWKLFLFFLPLLTKGKSTVRNKGLWAASYLNNIAENTVCGKQVCASQQAFTCAGNSPQPAHLLGSTEDERLKWWKCWVWSEQQKQTENNFLLESWSPRLPREWIQLRSELYCWNIPLGNHKKTFSDLIPEVLEKELASVLLLPVSTCDKKSKYWVGWRNMMQKPLHIIKPFSLFITHSDWPLLLNFMCAEHGATFVEISPHCVGGSCSLIKNLPTISVCFPLTSSLHQTLHDKSSSTVICSPGLCSSRPGHQEHCWVHSYSFSCHSCPYLSPPCPSLVPARHPQHRARPSIPVDGIQPQIHSWWHLCCLLAYV